MLIVPFSNLKSEPIKRVLAISAVRNLGCLETGLMRCGVALRPATSQIACTGIIKSDLLFGSNASGRRPRRSAVYNMYVNSY